MTSMPIPKRLRRFAREPLPDNDAHQNADIPINGYVDEHGLPAFTKTSIVLGLLCRVEGASIDELVAATDWQKHTTRAALTGLRKKGHVITRDKVDGVTRYRAVPPVSE